MTRRLIMLTAAMGVIGSGVAGLQIWRASKLLAAKPDLHAVAYVGADTCKTCHEDRHASWARTFHRSMTQKASAETVQGNFDGQRLSQFGQSVQPTVEAGTYGFNYLDDSGQSVGRAEVRRVVGSHRYQQYLTKHTGSETEAATETYYRLHYLWHAGEQRWVHMNAAFLGRDNQPFDAQVTNWNGTCVSCHNTGAEPRIQNLEALRTRAAAGEKIDFKTQARFDTSVAELGISCEACHAPGAEHTQRMQNWAARSASKILGSVDQSVVNPKHLLAARSNEVCGACHGQRTLLDTAQIDRFLSTGASYRPGDVLAEHVQVLQADTAPPPGADPLLYRNRFWADGDVRLTAYEFQAQAKSRCAQNSDLRCITCHTMHSGDPVAQLPTGSKDTAKGDAPCLRCHNKIAQNTAQHTQHAGDSAGARCVSCHMPRQVYGVMEVHRTHEIQLPDVAADLANGKPNACLNCHAEQTGAWAVAKLQQRWPTRAWQAPSTRGDGAPMGLSDGLSSLFAGDPVRQAVAAFELGQNFDAASARIRLPWLIAALADDRPGIRRFAVHSAQKISPGIGAASELGAALAAYDYVADSAIRAAALTDVQAAFARIDKTGWAKPAAETGLGPNYVLDPTILLQLQNLGAAQINQIDIGE
jgi:hypothetical protein